MINSELRKCENSIEAHQDYFIDNKINPCNALEYINELEKAQNISSDLSPKEFNHEECQSRTILKQSKKNGGKKVMDLMTSEDSVMTHSDTHAYSVSTNKRSLSKLDSISCMSISPNLKRVKTSELSDATLPILNDKLSLGQSALSVGSKKKAIRKSNRKRVISKVMLEAIGEDTETQ